MEAATAPFQYALSTRAGCECVSHAQQALCDMDEDATITSIDGISAHDTISRRAMLQGLEKVPGGSAASPFVRLFHAEPSTYLWQDDVGTTHRIHQGEGGEQGDPLMPLLHSLGQHAALEAMHARLHPGEKLFACSDDVWLVSQLWLNMNFGPTPRSKCTGGRLMSGTGQGGNLPVVTRCKGLQKQRIPTPESGEVPSSPRQNRASKKYWGALWGMKIS